MGRGLLLLLASLAVPSAARGSRPTARHRRAPTFKSGVDLVTVTATVRDRKGRLVKGWRRTTSKCWISGEPRRITDFRAEPSPVSLAILFDISGSMRVADRMLAGKFAAHHVLSWLEPGRDEAALFTFDSRLHEVAPFTVDTRALQGALGEVDPFGATSLHDAIAEAAQARGRRARAAAGRWWSLPTESIRQRADAWRGVGHCERHRRSCLHSWRPSCRSITSAAKARCRSPATEADDGTIENLATWTGGAFFYVSTPSDTSNASRQVLEELRTQYVIAFEPATADGLAAARNSDARRQKDHVVRARSGYVAGRSRGGVLRYVRYYGGFTMRKPILVVSMFALTLAVAPACATKKFVRTEVGQVNDKVATMGTSLEQTQERVRQAEGRITEVDAKAGAAAAVGHAGAAVRQPGAAGRQPGQRRGSRRQHPRGRDRSRQPQALSTKSS